MKRMTMREQELYDWPKLMLLQEAVDVYYENKVVASWYFLFMWARFGGRL